MTQAFETPQTRGCGCPEVRLTDEERALLASDSRVPLGSSPGSKDSSPSPPSSSASRASASPMSRRAVPVFRGLARLSVVVD